MAKKSTKSLTILFYFLIGWAAAVGLTIAFYWNLRLDASITNLINNYYYDVPLYFWPYVFFTFGTIILFGVNASLFTYRWRKYGPPRFHFQAGGGLGAVIGILASACPVCGSLLLSAIGITAGLAAFPFQGLELKALSFALMALPIFLTGRELSRFASGAEACPIPHNPSYSKKDKPFLMALIAISFALAVVFWNMLKTDPVVYGVFKGAKIINPGDNQLNSVSVGSEESPLHEIAGEVLPESGFQSKIYLGESVIKLIENGVIDRQKFGEIYEERGGLPEELKNVLVEASSAPILLTRDNANYYVNLLWPVGLANYMATNRESPILGESLFNFASTGGWNLGKEENGGAYFNKFQIVELTPEEEALATKIAKNTYRPCCGNSTFYQDCNHGSALLGLLQLGASQGLSEDELYKEALAFNSFWFPDTYLTNAVYFKNKGVEWEDVDPKVVLGKDFSSGQGASKIAKEVGPLPIGDVIGGSCGT